MGADGYLKRDWEQQYGKLDSSNRAAISFLKSEFGADAFVDTVIVYNQSADYYQDEDVIVAYSAVRNDKGEVFAVVSTMQASRSEYIWRHMDEGMGPYYHGCPISILDKLTPTDSVYARQWRSRCRVKMSGGKVIV